jgi:hypothetical protein
MKMNKDQRIAFGLPVDAAEIGDTGAQPLHRAALSEKGRRISGEDLPADRGQPDGQDRRAGQGEGHRIARTQCDNHYHDQNG